MKDFNFIIPILVKAGNDILTIGGDAPLADCRVISEENYQYLMDCRRNAFELLDALVEIADKLDIEEMKVDSKEFELWKFANDSIKAIEKAASC